MKNFKTNWICTILFAAAVLTAFGASNVSANDGDLDSSFNPLLTASGASFGKSMVMLPDGKMLVGGVFAQVNGTAAGSIARLNADGTVDSTFNVGGAGFAGGTPVIYTIVPQSDGKFLIGGIFTSYNGVARKNIVRINSDGSIDSSFNPGTGAGSSVFTIALQSDSKIIVGGAFATFNDLPNNRIVRLNSDGSVDSSFTVTMVPQVGVLAVAVQPDGKILMGGGWDFLNGAEWRFGLARLNTNGSTDTTFIPHNNDFNLYRASVATIVIQPDGKLLVGGLLRLNAAVSNKNIARFNADGTLDPTFDTGTDTIDGAVTQILPQANGKFLVGGYFHTLNGAAHDGFGRLQSNGVVDSSVVTQATPLGNPAGIDVMAQDAHKNVVIVGQFTAVNGTSRTGIARLQFAPRRKPTMCDYDGDGRTDFALRRIVNSQFYWWIGLSSGGTSLSQWGRSGNQVVCGDFDGDAKTDLAVWQSGVAGTAAFWILQSSDNVVRIEQFGQAQDNATVVDDFDGDGKTDVAVYRNGPTAGSQSYFYYLGSANNPNKNVTYLPWGVQFDRAYTADFDGDGKAEIAVERAIDGVATHFIFNPSTGQMRIAYMGVNGDSIIPGDFDGDGKTDIALLRNEGGGRTWYVTTDLGVTYTATRWGITNATGAVGDYDGDGKSDLAVYQNDTAGGGFNFFVINSGDSSTIAYRWGQNLDFPIAAFNTH